MYSFGVCVCMYTYTHICIHTNTNFCVNKAISYMIDTFLNVFFFFNPTTIFIPPHLRISTLEYPYVFYPCFYDCGHTYIYIYKWLIRFFQIKLCYLYTCLLSIFTNLKSPGMYLIHSVEWLHITILWMCYDMLNHFPFWQIFTLFPIDK